MTQALLESSFGLTNDTRNKNTDNHMHSSNIATTSLGPNRIDDEEVFIDHCDICFYLKQTEQRVKWCEWTEGKTTYTSILCRPCYVSLVTIGDKK